jgi:hypothetical protein
MPNNDEDARKKAEKPSSGGDKKSDPASGYSFFVDQPGNQAYNYGLSQPADSFSPPSWFNDMTTAAPTYNYDVTTSANAAPGSAPSSYPASAPIPAPGPQAPSPAPVSASVPASVPSSVQPASTTPAYTYTPSHAQGTQAQTSPYPSPSPQAQPSSLNHPQSAPKPESRQVFEQKESKEFLSLNLASDRRFANLHLSRELAETVDRIYGLVDLDFNGFVDFTEISKELNGEHLSESEKGFVKLIYALGCKILMERPALEANFIPVFSRDDFRLAFAYQCASVLGKDAESKGILTSKPQQKDARAVRASLFANNDDPLASLKSGAARLSTFGDPYFDAALASLVHMRPRSILRMLRVTADQSYQVSFGLYDKPLEVMPPRPEDIVAYGLTDRYGFWFPLLEKAYGINIAQKHKLAGKLGDNRNEVFNRASQAFEVLSGAMAETVVLANFASLDLLAYLIGLVQFQRAAIVIANDNITDNQIYTGRAPQPGKPYAFLSVDNNSGEVSVGTIYSENRTLNDEGVIRYSLDAFERYFKVMYCEHSSQTNSTNNENPWKKMNRGPRL